MSALSAETNASGWSIITWCSASGMTMWGAPGGRKLIR